MLEKEEIVSPNLEELKSHYRSIITLLGEDAEREGKRTSLVGKDLS